MCAVKVSTMRYPEYGHIGFKLLCCFYGWYSCQYMRGRIIQGERLLAVLEKKQGKLA
jgi:hypothetical protein